MSRKKINELIDRWESKRISDVDFLAEVFLMFRNKKEMSGLFLGLFSRQERKMLAMRMLIVKKIKENVSQREIAKKLKVGVTTITRGASEIEKGRFGFI